MSRPRWVLWAGLAAAVLLFGVPPLLALTCGWPALAPAEPRSVPTPAEPIAGPPPPTGLPAEMRLGLLVSGALFLGLSLGAWLPFLSRRGRESPGGRFILLIALGAASLSLYGLNLARPFSLQRYYNLKQIGIGLIADRDGGVALATALATVALFFFYGLAHRLCRGQDERRLWAVVLLGALLFALANVFVAPITSLDLYDYIARGRITAFYGGNPYVHTPEKYPGDPMVDYVSWRSATSAYGPLWEALSALLVRLAGNSLWSNMLAQKALALLSYLLSLFFLADTLRRTAPQRALAGTLLFAWNPLVLMEGLGNGHNDMLMAAFLLGAFWMLGQVRLSSPAGPTTRLLYGAVALVFLAASILVKFITVLFLPFFLLALLSGERRGNRWLIDSLVLLLPAVLLVAEHYALFWKWPELAGTFTRRVDMFRMTVASVGREALLPYLSEGTINDLVRGVFLGLFILAYLLLLGRAVWSLGRPAPKPALRIGLVGGGMVGTLGGLLWWYLGGWGLLGEPWGRELGSLAGLPLSLLLGLLLGAQVGAGSVFLMKPGKKSPSPWITLLEKCSSALFLYLLLANFWYWPWYLLLSIALLALWGDERLFAPLALSACAGELAHLGWNFVWYWWGITWETTYQMDALVVFWMVVPPLLVHLILDLRRRLAHASGADIQV
ncbi:MAG: hypothetical protein ACP5OO_08860 [Chloroflexia bacterium]